MPRDISELWSSISRIAFLLQGLSACVGVLGLMLTVAGTWLGQMHRKVEQMEVRLNNLEQGK